MFISIVRESGLQEWAIIELQGDIQFDENVKHSAEHFVGDLHYTKDNNTPVFIIGTHILHGKEISLPKPLAVLVKKKERSFNSDDSVEYVATAIVRKKLIFKSRPKPIVHEVPISK